MASVLRALKAQTTGLGETTTHPPPPSMLHLAHRNGKAVSIWSEVGSVGVPTPTASSSSLPIPGHVLAMNQRLWVQPALRQPTVWWERPVHCRP